MFKYIFMFWNIASQFNLILVSQSTCNLFVEVKENTERKNKSSEIFHISNKSKIFTELEIFSMLA